MVVVDGHRALLLVLCWEKEEEEEEEKRGVFPSPLHHALPALGILDSLPRAPCLPVHARCLRALWIPAHTSVMEAFWKISSVFVVPGGVQYMLCVSLRNSSCTWVRILRSIHLLSLVFSTLLILFSRPLVSGSHWFGVRRRSTGSYSALLGSTADTSTSSVYVVFKDKFYGPDSAENCRVLGQGDMPVVVANSGNASDSAHCPDFGTFPLATETGTPSANCAVSSCSSSTRLGSRACRYAATGADGPDSAALWMDLRPGQLIIAMLSRGGFFLGPCTQAQGRGPCPQGHGHP